MVLRSLVLGACCLAALVAAPGAAAEGSPQAAAGHELGPARLDAGCAFGDSLPFACGARAWLGPEESPYALEADAGTGGSTHWDVALTRRAR